MEKVDNKVMNSPDWTVQAFVDGRISSETHLQPDGVELILVLDAKAGRIQEDESELFLRKALFNVERGRDEFLRRYASRRFAQIEAASAAALVTVPTATWGMVLKESARMSTQSEQNLNTATFRLHDGIPEHSGLPRDQFVMRDVSENAKTQHEMWSRRKSSAQNRKADVTLTTWINARSRPINGTMMTDETTTTCARLTAVSLRRPEM